MALTTLLDVVLFVIGGLVLSVVGYRLVLALGFLLRAALADGTRIEEERIGSVRFAIVIPAHDESATIEECLASIRRANYPIDLVTPYVIADNCSDDTPAVASRGGAVVLSRFDPTARGKGHALAWAIPRIPYGSYEALVVIDADTQMDPEFLRVMADRIGLGSRILQGFDGVANPTESALTRLMAVTNTMKNLLFNGGKSALGLSPFLMGTGMVFAAPALREHPWRAVGIVESIEQSLILIEAGERIEFVPQGVVFAQEAASFRNGFAQRQRWASGQMKLTGMAVRSLLLGILRFEPTLIDAGLDLLLPFRYSKTLYMTLLTLASSIVLAPDVVPIAILGLGLQAIEFALGMVQHPNWRGLGGALAIAPVFMIWKFWIDCLAMVGFRRNVWHRTRRNPPAEKS